MDISAEIDVQAVDINTVKPYEGNPRRNRSSVANTANSIKENGWRQPIVVDEDMVIIAGHTRLLAAKRLKLKQVPIHVAIGLSDERVKAYRLMDNRAGEDSVWIDDLLKVELTDLLHAGYDIALTGFSGEQLYIGEQRVSGVVGTGFDGPDADSKLAGAR